MLFGNEEFQKKFMSDVLQFAEEKNFMLLYGALVGGISKGLQYEDSDYDTRFLYVDRSNPEKIYIPFHEKEKDLKHRVYFDNLPYEFIPLWEFTSFMQFLHTPAFDGKESCGLYNIIGWTLQSPYTWDPYGIQMKIIPIMNSVFRKEKFIPYHVDQIKEYFSKDSQVIIKDYLYAIYAALSIKWAIERETFPPVYMKSLVMEIAPVALRSKVLDMIDLSKKLSAEYLHQGEENEEKLQESHYVGNIAHDAEIDAFINQMREEAGNIIPGIIDEGSINAAIEAIYELVRYSVQDETKVRGVNV